MKVSEIIGQRVREAREADGMTQRELGQRVGEMLTGRPWFGQTVSAAEKGRRDWSVNDLVAVAWVLDRPVQWFLQTDEYKLQLGDHGAIIRGRWFPGRDQERERTVEELVTEVHRLTLQLRRALKPPEKPTEPKRPKRPRPRTGTRVPAGAHGERKR